MKAVLVLFVLAIVLLCGSGGLLFVEESKALSTLEMFRYVQKQKSAKESLEALESYKGLLERYGYDSGFRALAPKTPVNDYSRHYKEVVEIVQELRSVESNNSFGDIPSDIEDRIAQLEFNPISKYERVAMVLALAALMSLLMAMMTFFIWMFRA